MGGWEEGVPSVGRPVTTKKSRHDSYFTSRAVTYHFQLSNQSGGRLVVAPEWGVLPVDVQVTSVTSLDSSVTYQAQLSNQWVAESAAPSSGPIGFVPGLGRIGQSLRGIRSVGPPLPPAHGAWVHALVDPNAES